MSTYSFRLGKSNPFIDCSGMPKALKTLNDFEVAVAQSLS